MELEKLHPFEINEIKRTKNPSKLHLWCHYNDLEHMAARWLENAYEVVDMEEVLQRTVDTYPILEESEQNGLLVQDILRKYVMELIRNGKGIPATSCELLTEYAKQPGKGPNEEDEQLLLRLFSCLTRKEFDYFINRYYLLDPDTPHQRRTERWIARYMGFWNVAGKRRWKGLTSKAWRERMYVEYLDSIPRWFLEQINNKKFYIMGHPDAAGQEWNARWYRRNRTELWVTIVTLTVLVIGLFVWERFFM